MLTCGLEAFVWVSVLESSHVRYHWKRCSQHGEDEVALVVTVAIFAVLGYSLWCLSQLTSQSAGKAQADNIYLSPYIIHQNEASRHVASAWGS